MKPKYARVYGKWGLRSARKAQDDSPVSGVVVVSAGGRKGYTTVRFSTSFTEAVGRALPQGIGQHNPCFIKAVYHARSMKWKIYAEYLYFNKRVLLLELTKTPDWLEQVRY